MLKGLLLTALPLSDSQQAAIESRFSAVFGETVSLEVRLQENLLGGIRVELGGRVYDGSLRWQLNNVLNALQTGEEDGGNA